MQLPSRRVLSLLMAGLILTPAAALAQSSTSKVEKVEKDEDALDRARRGQRNEVENFYRSQAQSELDFDAAWRIPERTIELPWAEVKLGAGYIVPVKPAELDEKDTAGQEVPERKYIGAVFLGDGSFEWTAPTPTEQWMLNFGLSELKIKTDELSKLDTDIAGGAVLFFNGRYRALLEEGGEAATLDSKQQKAVKGMWKSRADLFQSQMARMDTVDTYQGEERGFFVLDMATDTFKNKLPWLTYNTDPGAHEGNQLFVIKRYALNKDSLNSWDLGSWVSPELDAANTDRELAYLALHNPVDIQHYVMDMRVYRDNDVGEWGMAIDGSVEFEFLDDNQKMIAFDMAAEGENEQPIEVQNVTDTEGNLLPFLHKGGQLLVKLDRAYHKGETLKLHWKSDGLYIMTISQPPPSGGLDSQEAAGAVVKLQNFRVPNGAAWYPKMPGYGDLMTFDWTLRLPKPMVAATSGTLLEVRDEDKMNVHIIKATEPLTFPAIIFGRYSVHENDPDYSRGEVKIRVYTHPGMDKDAQSFLDEAQGIIAYYSALYGPYPYAELDLAQMPIGMGYAQAPAGLVQMTGETYVSKTDLVNLFGVSDPQLRDYFIPHELAHHWWGGKAGFGTTRDQWISETFAEFSAALYVEFRDQQKSGDPNDTSGYDNRMFEWKRQRRGDKVNRTAPLWVGYRAGPARAQASIYARGPLIMDMLRRNFGREAVVKAMYTYVEFCQKNMDLHGGNAITEDWQLVLEQVMKMGFDTFTKQFIKLNAEIPSPETGRKKKK